MFFFPINGANNLKLFLLICGLYRNFTLGKTYEFGFVQKPKSQFHNQAFTKLQIT